MEREKYRRLADAVSSINDNIQELNRATLKRNAAIIREISDVVLHPGKGF
jgi:hypothetical protein